MASHLLYSVQDDRILSIDRGYIGVGTTEPAAPVHVASPGGIITPAIVAASSRPLSIVGNSGPIGVCVSSPSGASGVRYGRPPGVITEDVDTIDMYATEENAKANVALTGVITMTRDAPAVFNRAEWSLPALPANTPFGISFEYLFSPSTVTTTAGAVATQLGFSDADPAVRLSAFGDFRTIEGAGYRFGYNQYGSRVLFTYDSGTSQAVLASVSASLVANAWYTFGLAFDGANTWTYSVAPSSSLANVASGSVIDANVGANIRSSAFGNRVRMLADTGTFCSPQKIRNFSFQILTPYVDTTVAGNTWQMLSSATNAVMLSANGTTGTVTANDIAVSRARVRYGQANEKTLTTTAFANVLLYGSTFNTPENVASTGNLRLTNGTVNQVQTVQYPASGLIAGCPFAISCDYTFNGTGDGFCMQAFASDTGTAAPFAFSGFSTIANAGFRFGYTAYGGRALFGYSDASATTILASNVIALSNNTTYRCAWTFDGVQTWTYAMSTGGNAVLSGTVANASTLGNMTRALYPSVVRFRASSGSATADQWVSNVQITYGLQCADTVFTGNSWQLRLGNGFPVVVVNTTAAGGGLGASIAGSLSATSANIGTATMANATANTLTVGGLVLQTSSADYNYAQLGCTAVYYRATTAQTSAGVQSAVAVAIAGDVPQTAVSRASGNANVGSLFFRGRGSYLTVPGMSYANTPAFNTNEYTMECLVNFPGNATVNNVTYLMGTFDPILGLHVLSMFAFDGRLNCRYQSLTTTPGSQAFYSNSQSIKANTWHHCALTLTGTTANTGVIRLFLDGVAQELMYAGTTSHGFSTPKVNMFSGTTVPFAFAQHADFGYDPFYLDSARVLLGNAAYTANFTPPANLAYGPAGATTLLLANVRRGSPDMQISSFGNVSINAPVAILASPATFLPNGQMTFSLLNNTTLAIQARGTDGVLRSGNITLA